MHLDKPRLPPVARAYKVPNQTIIHGTPLQDDQVKVSVISVMEGQDMTRIPFCTKEITTLGQAVRAFIFWPKRLVFDTPQEAPPPKLLQKVLKLSYCLSVVCSVIDICV